MSGTGVGSHHPVRLQGIGQELGVGEFQLVRQEEGVSLVVEMANGGHLNGASADAECSTLHGLKLCNSGGGGVGGPYWGGLVRMGLIKAF